MVASHRLLRTLGPAILLVLLVLVAAGCSTDERGGEAAGPSTSPLVGHHDRLRCPELGDGILPAQLLELHDDDEIRRVIDECLAVDETMARAFALSYAERELRLQSPATVRLVLPVEDSLGTPIAWQVILSANAGREEGLQQLSDEVASHLRAVDPESSRSTFRQMHDFTAHSHATINVAAYLYRHPINRAHRGVPRWLVELDEARERCPASLEPTAILPAEGIPGVVRLVRYACGDETFLYSHYANSALDGAEVRTRHVPVHTFRHWSERISTGYDDPSERLRFIEGLWLRFLPEGGQR